MKLLNLNKKKNGRWLLSGDYLQYKKAGGELSPQDWNSQIKEIKKRESLRNNTKSKDFKTIARALRGNKIHPKRTPINTDTLLIKQDNKN